MWCDSVTNLPGRYSANTQRNKHVIITPKRRFGVIITCLLRFVFAGYKSLMPQSHHTPGPRTGCSRAVHRLFWTKIVRPLTGPARAPCGAVRILPSRTGPVEFSCMHYKFTGPGTGLEILNSPWTARAGIVRGPYGPRTAKYDARAGFLPILVVSIPLRVRKDTVRHPCGSRTGPVRVP